MTEKSDYQNWMVDNKNSLFAQIINFSPVGIFQVDPDDRFIYINTRWQTITRFGLKEALGKYWWEPILAEDRDSVFQEWAKSEQSNRECLVHCRIKCSDGEIRWVELRSRFLFYDLGKVTFGTLEDITDRKIMERRLEEYSRELERSNRDLEDFAAIASHDLQEPLRKIMNFGDRLAGFFDNPDPDRARDYLGRIQSATQRMKDFIENLLDFSRVTTKANAMEPLDLGSIIEEVISLFEIRIQSTEGRVEVGPMPPLTGDLFQFRQLFQNLIGNALKFQREGVPPVVTLSSTENPGSIEIRVQDNGVGFDEKYMEKIFKPFERLHGRSKFEGSGMGLAICKKIVDRHGGTLSATSEPGSGTCFILTFPTKTPKPQAA